MRMALATAPSTLTAAHFVELSPVASFLSSSGVSNSWSKMSSWNLYMLSAALLRGTANLRMYGCEAVFSVESFAKESTRTAGRLLAVIACRLKTEAGDLCRRQQGLCSRLDPIIAADSRPVKE
ncbi:hypothetical protein COO60DRAFT_1538769 [Scenedesmus sp. NREL 46B-D3]|nr:hypothetical protein COO60DRAFT_1538769 [Scenedesmus sp. NREL 46B-D3]